MAGNARYVIGYVKGADGVIREAGTLEDGLCPGCGTSVRFHNRAERRAIKGTTAHKGHVRDHQRGCWWAAGELEWWNRSPDDIADGIVAASRDREPAQS